MQTPTATTKITIVYGDDWMGCYVDGELHWQGDRDGWENEVDMLQWGQSLAPYTVDGEDIDLEWLYEYGCLPDKLSDCKFATYDD